MKKAYRIKRGRLLFTEEHEFSSSLRETIWKVALWRRGCKIINEYNK